MAYNKRNWKARQGTGLNYFSIDGATPVPIVNQPTTLTEAGDALSAGNLNDWEQRIKDGFDDADASIANVQGNLESYETTNDLRVAANSQDIQNIQNALLGTVIQEHVDSTQKNVKTILSADELLPWAILKRVGARSTQFNQFFADSYSITYSGTPTEYEPGKGYKDATSFQSDIVPIGHKILLWAEITPLSNNIERVQVVYGSSALSLTLTPASPKGNVIESYANDGYFFLRVFTTDLNNYSFSLKVNGTDLTVMNEYDSGKTDAENIASFRAKFPASYYPFNAGDIYDVPPLSFLYRGTNQWDEDLQTGYFYNTSTGSKQSSENWNCSRNKQDCLGGTDYYLSVKNKSTFLIHVIWFDANDNYITYDGKSSAGIVTSPSNASKFAMNIAIEEYGGTTYNHDIMICLNSVTDKTYRPANHRTIDTSFMAGKKYVNSSCYDYAENVYVNGILKRKNQTVVGAIDLGTLNWGYSSGCMISGTLPDVGTIGSVGSSNNSLCAKYITKSSRAYSDSYSDYECGLSVQGNQIVIKDPNYGSGDESAFKTAVTGLYFYYELATLSDPTYGDPIPNFPCEDGSTIMANTPQTEIVNAIDVPSTIGYSTKIA